jgi:hypothetical protein
MFLSESASINFDGNDGRKLYYTRNMEDRNARFFKLVQVLLETAFG